VLQFWENGPLSFAIVVAARHDTLYRNDAGGIKSSRRWLSEATPSGYEMGVKAAGTPSGGKTLCRVVVSGGVVAETLLNHRLQAPDASGIVAIKKSHSWLRRVYDAFGIG
ncbi:MAG: hypothetical protein WCJ40_03710, partial [Planctomycetota bacterium]